MSESKRDSTEQLIAEGEALRGGKGGKKAPRTKQIVREAEELIGRRERSSGGRLLMVAVLVVAAAGAAYVFLR